MTHAPLHYIMFLFLCLIGRIWKPLKLIYINTEWWSVFRIYDLSVNVKASGSNSVLFFEINSPQKLLQHPLLVVSNFLIIQNTCFIFYLPIKDVMLYVMWVYCFWNTRFSTCYNNLLFALCTFIRKLKSLNTSSHLKQCLFFSLFSDSQTNNPPLIISDKQARRRVNICLHLMTWNE